MLHNNIFAKHTFICTLDMGESTSLAKWSSLELLAEEDDSPPPAQNSISCSYILYICISF